MSKAIKCLSFIFVLIFTPIRSSFNGLNFKNAVNDISSQSSDESQEASLNVHFIKLGGVGDFAFIKFGKTDIVIDAGGNKNSTKPINEALTKYCTDGVIDFMIITHPDRDHVVSFYSAGGVSDWLEQAGHSCTTFIDFDVTKDKNVVIKNLYEKLNSSDNYRSYAGKRDKLISEKKIANYYTSSQCCYSKEGFSASSNGAQDSFELDSGIDGTPKAYLHILYNEYNIKRFSSNEDSPISSQDINNLSVCSLIEFKTKKLLFCGDLQEYESSGKRRRILGETKLVENNESFLKDGVTFFKASHHGSISSNSKKLLDMIRPQYVYIPTVVKEKTDEDNLEDADEDYDEDEANTTSTNEGFPRQAALNNICRWTDYISIPEIKTDKEITEYYGATNYTFAENSNSYSYTNTSTPLSIFETEWYKVNRKVVSFIYELTPKSDSGNLFNTQGCCVYAKYGHIDILINSGIESTSLSCLAYTDRIKNYCNDKVLDYVIVTNIRKSCISELVGDQRSNSSSLLLQGDFKIGTYIDNKYAFSQSKNDSFFTNYYDTVKKAISNETIAKYYDSETITKNNSGLINFAENGYLKVLNCPYNIEKASNFEDNSMACLLSLGGINYLNVGFQEDPEKLESLLTANSVLNKSIGVFEIPYYGYTTETSAKLIKAYKNFISEITSPTGINLISGGPCGKKNVDGEMAYPNYMFVREIIMNSNYFATTRINPDNLKVLPMCDDIYCRIITSFDSNSKAVSKCRIINESCFDTASSSLSEENLFNEKYSDDRSPLRASNFVKGVGKEIHF